MGVLKLSEGHRQRRVGLPVLRAVNVWWDNSIGSFFPRPSLVEYETKGSGAIRGEYVRSGLFNGDRFWLSGDQLWRESSVIASLAGDGRARFAGGKDGADDCLIIVADGLVYEYVSGAVNLVAMPDDVLIYDVVYYGNRFLYFRDDGRFYPSELNDPTYINPALISSADYKPDGFLRAVVASNVLYIIGPKSIEPWYITADAAQPFVPSTGSRLDVGAFSADAVLGVEDHFYLISDKRQVFQFAGGLNPIADDSVLEALSLSDLDDISLCVVYVQGREIFLLNDLAVSTYAYDGRNWYRWERSGKPSLHITGAITSNGVTYAGDASTGLVYRFDAEAFEDEAGAVQKIVSALLPVTSKGVRIASLALQCGRASGTVTVTDPSVEMRYSDDNGGEWTDWDAESLGRHGNFSDYPVWVGLGMVEPQGRLFEFRCSDAVSFSPQAALVNEARP